MKPVRCAIYTRKSSDEGLDQAFNSLDAQREACAAYVFSQAGEGWTALPEVYDDGGLSGGTLERPALRRLLAEVAAGRVGIIVVYKVDRLTRSLFDFAKLVETFDAAGTSFVSVTQSFNTTTSMGRLTLNMLLSFAQFEREVTAERIRDKIAASKAKGMWMGGTPPLGYKPDGRTLAIVSEHAAIVRDVFDRYLALGNVRLVFEQLTAAGVHSPVRVIAKTGATYGGVPLSRGQIYKLLTCPTYVGEVHHGNKVYPGLHEAIVDRDTWDSVQAKLVEGRQGHRTGARATRPSLLAGRVVDAAGEALTATHANKGTVRHRYYVSRGLHHGTADTGMRIPARELESMVLARLTELMADPLELARLAGIALRPDSIAALHTRCAEAAVQLAVARPALVTQVVQEVQITETAIVIRCDTAALAAALAVDLLPDAPDTLELRCEARLTRSGQALRLVQANGAAAHASPDKSLIKLVVKARRWWRVLRSGTVTIGELAASEGVTQSYAARVIRLAYLSPAGTEALLAGRLRAGVTATKLMAEGAIAPDWQTQQAMLLPA